MVKTVECSLSFSVLHHHKIINKKHYDLHFWWTGNSSKMKQFLSTKKIGSWKWAAGISRRDTVMSGRVWEIIHISTLVIADEQYKNKTVALIQICVNNEKQILCLQRNPSSTEILQLTPRKNEPMMHWNMTQK